MSDTFRKEYKDITEEQKADILAVKNKAQELWDLIDKNPFLQHPTDDNPSGIGTTRYGSLAKTSLEEAVMWAVKGITT